MSDKTYWIEERTACPDCEGKGYSLYPATDVGLTCTRCGGCGYDARMIQIAFGDVENLTVFARKVEEAEGKKVDKEALRMFRQRKKVCTIDADVAQLGNVPGSLGGGLPGIPDENKVMTLWCRNQQKAGSRWREADAAITFKPFVPLELTISDYSSGDRIVLTHAEVGEILPALCEWWSKREKWFNIDGKPE